MVSLPLISARVPRSFLQGAELEAVVAGMEGCRGGRGAYAVSETVRSLMDHPRVLPLVVDCCGWNIQVRATMAPGDGVIAVPTCSFSTPNVMYTCCGNDLTVADICRCARPSGRAPRGPARTTHPTQRASASAGTRAANSGGAGQSGARATPLA